MWGFRRPDPPLPPPPLRFMNEDDARFLDMGSELVTNLRREVGLDLGRSSRVVDVGCGYGRVAHALIRADARGRYIGFDILPKHIGWCQENLATSRIRFEHLDVRNDRYNPRGTLDATTATLPVPSDWADVALATSVFTHMWPAEIVHYLEELARFLRPGGRGYLTFFLLDDSWQRLTASGAQQSYALPHRGDGPFRYADPDNPLHVIAYDLDWVEQSVADAGLKIREIALGQWAGRESWTFQDVVMVERLS